MKATDENKEIELPIKEIIEINGEVEISGDGEYLYIETSNKKKESLN